MEESDYDKLRRVFREMGIEAYAEFEGGMGKSFVTGSDEYGDLCTFHFSSDGKYTGVSLP